MKRAALFPLMFLLAITLKVAGQADKDPPLSPKFTLVTIDPANGHTVMTWMPSPSSDVAGYVVYLYKGGEGYAIDTIFDPLATSYSARREGTSYYSESYVVAAIDYSGNTSPLSNELATIFASLQTDTCNNRIILKWNKYNSFPTEVTGYDILVSVNSGAYYLAGHTSAETTEFFFGDISTGSDYCFTVGANLQNGQKSVSGKACASVRIQRIPEWINADFATVNDNDEISLSFTIDPLSETDLFSVERRQGFSGSFQQIARISKADADNVAFTDKTALKNTVYFYRLAAINSCNIKAAYSNVASGMILQNKTEGNEILLGWNRYREWNGTVSSYTIYMDAGNGFSEIAASAPVDTTHSIGIPDIMYTLSEGRVCFYVTASETGNPHGIQGEARSNISCVTITETAAVPNVFTPDGDLKNDLFKPVLTYTPDEYRLVITDRQGKIIFDTDAFAESWDGRDKAGKMVNEGVYLWFLSIKTPSGKNISRTGTVTLIRR
ncbi:MAG TPA: gliding motility-associated C-terminal domain-containing protein [Bacteroidales bacterium]|jgi:gliding motility-associated-like protein|nr:gliding motility-associated C-terminal domain-containing protein [Bacteroidales bacterium]